MSDLHYANVSLLLPMSGVNNGTVFTDYSPVPKTVTRFGDTKTVTAQSKYYGSSAYFDGVGDYLTVPTSESFNFLDDDFCIEFFIRFDPASMGLGTWILNKWDSVNNRREFGFTKSVVGSDNVVRFLISSDGANSTILESTSVLENQWIHVAVSREANTVRLFIEGALAASSAFSGNVFYAEQNQIVICASNLFLASHTGHLQDLRITKGVARYTANFTPPARLIGEISGTVTDDAGQPAVRKIVAFPRVYPQRTFITDSAADGTYTLQVPATEHSRIVLDDAGGTLYNDIIDRVIPG